MSWRVTVPCTRAQGEAVPDADDLFADSQVPPVLVADEPDESRPDDWLIHAYFEHDPSGDEIARLTNLGSGPPRIEKLDEQNWVAMSQAGLQPIRAGRFTVHTPTYPPDADRINFEIDAGLAFGTGQHATTSGCLEALDKLERKAPASPTSPISAAAPACSPLPRCPCGRKRNASRPTSTKWR